MFNLSASHVWRLCFQGDIKAYRPTKDRWAIPQAELLSVLPESAESLAALASLGEADLAEHLQAWEQAQAARLRHLTFQLVPSQIEVVEEAFERVMAGVIKDTANPNRRGNALYHLCRDYLDRSESP